MYKVFILYVLVIFRFTAGKEENYSTSKNTSKLFY